MKSDKVQFGAKLKISNVDTEEEMRNKTWTRRATSLGRISVASPLSRDLLGHHEGDEVKVRLPVGERTYEILEIRYG